MRVQNRRSGATVCDSKTTTGRLGRFMLLVIVAVVILALFVAAKTEFGESEGQEDSAGTRLLASGNSASGADGTVGDAPSSPYRLSDEGDLFERDVDAGQVADTEKLFTRDPPFMLPASLQAQGYTQGRDIETWRAVSDSSCRDVAREILVQLRSTGMELKESGYLDLFGEAWGCTLEDHGEASITVTLIPEKPFNQRSISNPLCMTLIRTAVPKLNMPGQDS